MAEPSGSGGRRYVRRRSPGNGRGGAGGGGSRMRRSRRAVQIALGVAAAAVVAVIATVVANRSPGQGVGQSLTSTVTAVFQGGQPMNVLLIGNNARGATTPTAAGQADLLYVVHFVPQSHTIDVISVPRDTMVAFPGWRIPIPKIKTALLMGGATLEAQSVSKLVGMPIQGYVEADFAGFAAAIDAVGGVSVDIPARLYDPTFSHANFQPGYQHLNGTQALAYVRIRQNQANSYRTNSFQRQSAGTQVMLALKQQVLSHESLGGLSKLAGVLRQDFATNLSTSTLIGLLASADHATIHSVTIGQLDDTMVIDSTAIPGVNTTGQIVGAYYDILTPQGIEQTLKPFGAKDPQTGLAPLPAPSSVPVSVTNDANGRAYAARLQAAGFAVTMNGPSASGGGVTVGYPAGQLPAAEAVARQLGTTNEVLQQTGAGVVTVSTP